MSSCDMVNVLWFDELYCEDVNLVGGKLFLLGEMMLLMDVLVLYGFVIIVWVYQYFMIQMGLNDKVNDLLVSIQDYENFDELYIVCE